MALVKKKLGINVVEAAKIRIKNVFSNGLKVYLSVSGGKDSIVLSSLVYDLITSGEIDPKQLSVNFIDEEVIFPDVIKICLDWRRRFLLAGAEYVWFTVEHRANNCFDTLENNESFIPWDRYASDKWAHKKPSFAVSESPYLIPRTETYQEFFERYHRDGITIIGVRAAESIQRQQYLSKVNSSKPSSSLTWSNTAYPIYDWKDSDVWKYIQDHNLDFPDVYLKMYEAGVPKNKLRVCSMFSIDTCKTLNLLFETYPDLWEIVLRREPNAYLVRLYWDTEMFRRNTQKRRVIEEESGEKIDYKAKVFELVNHPQKYFHTKRSWDICMLYKSMIIDRSKIIPDSKYKEIYDSLIAGDPKARSYRAIYARVLCDYNKRENIDQDVMTR